MKTSGSVRSRFRPRLGRGGGLAIMAGLLVALVLLAAGCGGGSKPPSVASLGTTTSSGTATSPASSAASVSSGPASPSGSQSGFSMKMVGGNVADEMKLAACMRSNGVPSFPDPNAEGVFSGSGIDASSPAFQKAMQTCQKLLPNGGKPTPAQLAQGKAQMLKYSACMRSHGLPNFPEPNAQGNLQINFGSGLDPNSPQFQAAQKACGSLAPGGGGAP